MKSDRKKKSEGWWEHSRGTGTGKIITTKGADKKWIRQNKCCFYKNLLYVYKAI
jgi:hypothetical protein